MMDDLFKFLRFILAAGDWGAYFTDIVAST